MDDFVVVLQILEIEWTFDVFGSNGINGVEVSIGVMWKECYSTLVLKCPKDEAWMLSSAFPVLNLNIKLPCFSNVSASV